MAALVQTYPQQSGTVTLLQTRPESATAIMSGTSQGHSGQAYGNASKNGYYGSSGGGGPQSGYRSGTGAPVQPYAFTSTPGLANSGQLSQHGGYRTASGTTVPALPQMVDPRMQPSVPANRQSNTTSTQATFAQAAASKASPERYRRTTPRLPDSLPSVTQAQQAQGSGMATAVPLYTPRAVPRNQVTIPNRPQSAYGGLTPSATMDDMRLFRHHPEDEAKRYRRRSIHSINSPDFSSTLTTPAFARTMDQTQTDGFPISKKMISPEKDQKPGARAGPLHPASNSMHIRNGSSESTVSNHSSNSRPPSSANRNANASVSTAGPASISSSSREKAPASDQSKLVSVPPRGSSADVNKRVLSPSPLSNPATMPSGSSSHKPQTDSLAAQQLAAINEKGAKPKSKTSRLRRAFSFGSAAELRQVTGQSIGVDPAITNNGDISRLHKDPRAEDLYEAEQARIARKQEEGGIGSSIYAGTKLFGGSTDDLSISSTASSASMMLRKMGRGVKKSSRSLVGLFRPKSMVGSPNDDSAELDTRAMVSMVTAEAERDRVNVTTNAELTRASGTGFPHLERNSIDATKNPGSLSSDRVDSSSENSTARKSVVSSEKERAEVLATIRKGILKTRSNSPSPPEGKAPTFDLPAIPNMSDSPNSSAPSTPNDDASHKRSGSVTIGNEDYFMSALRFRQDSKGALGTPHKRNATFSPRIIFYDTWPSGEYDRRGEIATCNRLTPVLAQQIKEELNSFKMEMEVHETSKIYTHFF
ncbi:hypothetical protein GGS21DRAFT_205112 [Xylaria nigripes]|nr:hypothetical protein GGS21DRAFT_205112 [Xylaria nigripes]